MWEILVIHVDKVRKKGLKEGIDRYASMMGGEWSLRLVHTSRSHRDNPEAAKEEEGRAMAKAIPTNRTVIAMDPGGETMTSRAFARLLSELKNGGRRVVFLVGGAHGLAPGLLASSQHRIALSAMTFPHELATLMLVEQLYRAQAISMGKPYAK